MRENIQYLSILMAPKLVHIFSPEFLNHGVSASVGCCDLDLKALAQAFRLVPVQKRPEQRLMGNDGAARTLN